MEIVLHALNGVLTIMLMIAVGFYLERRGWFSEESVALISRLVNYVCLPTYMLTNILGQFKHDQLITLSHGLIVPVISMLAGYFISRRLGRTSDRCSAGAQRNFFHLRQLFQYNFYRPAVRYSLVR